MAAKGAASAIVLLGALAACAFGVPACRAPTAITLEITTDVPCEKIRGTQIAVGSTADVEGKDAAAVTPSCKNGYVGTLVVVPSSDKSSEIGVRVVMGVDRPPEECPAAGYAGCIVARRALHFIPHSDLTLPIAMRQVCVGDPCDPRSTCVEGSCVSSTVPACTTRCELAPPDAGPVDASADSGPPVPHAHVAPGGQHTCVLRTDGHVRCAGKNSSGAFGDGTTSGAQATSDAFVGIADATAIAIGYDFGCVLRAGGTVACTGRNESNEVGSSALGSQVTSPTTVPGVTGVTKLAVSQIDGNQPPHACALSADGLRCWGSNSRGQITVGGADPVMAPVVVPAGAGALDVATGWEHTCVITATRHVACWGCRPTGSTTYGCLSEAGATGTATGPEMIPGLDNVIDLAAGAVQTCAIRSDKTVWCFGTNVSGELGNQIPLGTSMPTPTAIPGIDDAVHVAASYATTCVLRASGAVTCFGRNTAGACGNGTIGDTCAPSPVIGITDAVDLGVGFLNGCVVRANGDIACWGRDTDGETTGVPPGSVQTYSMPTTFSP